MTLRALRIASLSLVGLTFLVPPMRGQSSTDAVLQQRLELLESRLRQVEGRLTAPGDASAEDAMAEDATDVADLLARLEARMATVERLVDAPETTPPAQEAIVAARAITPDPAEADAPEDNLVPSDLKGLYLPSRGHAGGVLHYGETEQRIALHAFLDLEYIDAGPDGSRSGVSTFDNHHANLFVRSVIRPNLLGHIEFEYEHGGDVVEIDQAFLEWAATDWLSLRAGRFYTPFGIERFVWYAPTNALVSRPSAMRSIVPGNFYANGLQIGGILQPQTNRRLSYELAITDGLGENALNDRRGSRQTRDNNSSRALSGRLGYAIGHRMEFGASFHHQRYASQQDLDLTFLGLDFSGRWKGFELRSEWLEAEIETATVSGDVEQRGFYAQLAYSFHWNRDLVPEVRLISRYDELDLDRAVSGNDDQRRLSVGLNVLIYDHFRTKLEYQFGSEDGPSRDDDAFLMQLVLDY
ncbi:MAG: porin [Acidobacteriota bacterium]